MTLHAITCQIAIAIGVLGIAHKAITWTMRPAINQRLVHTVAVGPNMCAGFKTANSMR